MEGLDSAALLDRVVGHPTSFDLVQLEFWMVQRALAAGSLQGIPVAKLRALDSLLPLFTKGTVGSREVSRQGTPPHKVQYVDRPDSGVAHSNPTGHLSLAATVCNSDTLGWRPDRVDRPIRSWSDLFAADLRGRVALSRIASVSIVELALACEASGRLAYADKGNMTRAEIDATLSTLERAWIKGKFVGTWRRFEESVELMSEGAVALQSLWPPAEFRPLRQRGILLPYGMLEEGGRGWAGGFALASHLRGARRDAALGLHQLVPVWLGRRTLEQAGVLLRDTTDRPSLPYGRRVELLVRGPPRVFVHPRSHGRKNRAARLRARRRLVRSPDGTRRRLEQSHGRRRLSAGPLGGADASPRSTANRHNYCSLVVYRPVLQSYT